MDMFDLAGALFGNRSNPVAQGPSLTATGSTASTDGVAGVTFDADVTPAEDTGEDVDQTVIDLPTSPDVAEGDEVIVTLVGDGPLKTPIVTANPGSGDRMAASVSNAVGLAQAAEAVASATGQHFWPDDDGVHVTEVTQEEWNDSTGASYHSGANVLLNALGQLFRDGLNNLLALLSGDSPGVAIYDGAGNDASNIIASFTGEGTTVGYASGRHLSIDSDSIDMKDGADTLWSISSATSGAPRIMTEKQVYYIGAVTAESDASSEVVGSTYFSQDISFGSSIELNVSNQWPNAGGVKAASLALSAPAPTNSISTKSRIYAIAEQLVIHGVVFDTADVADMLTTESATLTRGSGASSWVSGQLRRSGKVIVVTIFDMHLAAALASGANSPVVGTVPAGYRPAAVQRVPCALSVTGNYANVWAAIGTSGAIVIHNGSGLSIPTTATISLNCAYIID